MVCFLPGTLALGHHHGLDVKHLNLAKALLETCNRMYTDMPTGLSPEIAYFNLNTDGSKDIIVKVYLKFFRIPYVSSFLYYPMH